MTSSGRLVPVSPAVEEEEEEDMMALVSGSGVVSLPSTTRSPGHIIVTVFWNTLYHHHCIVSPSGGPSGEEEVEAVDSTETLREKYPSSVSSDPRHMSIKSCLVNVLINTFY